MKGGWQREGEGRNERGRETERERRSERRETGDGERRTVRGRRKELRWLSLARTPECVPRGRHVREKRRESESVRGAGSKRERERESRKQEKIGRAHV